MSLDRAKLKEIIGRLGNDAFTAGQALGPQHLFMVALAKRAERTSDPAARISHDAIASQLLPATEKAAAEQDVSSATFDVLEAIERCLGFLAEKPNLPDFDQLLWWLLADNYDDAFTFFGACRRVCYANRMTPAAFVATDRFDTPKSEIGLGFFIADDANVDGKLIGRDADIERHLGLLRNSLLADRHYLITGERGVGKTAFLETLLQRAQRRFATEASERLRHRRFLVLRPEDLMFDPETTKQRVTTVFDLLGRNPSIIPVFDDIHTFLEPALPGASPFRELIGLHLIRPRQSFVLTSTVTPARKDELLRTLQAHPLPALDGDSTVRLAANMLEARRQENAVKPTLDPSADTIAQEIVASAREYYPSRFFPEVALHLASSTIERGVARIDFLKEAPLDRIGVEDLKAAIVGELGIAPETLGQNPDAFYNELERKLAAQIIGQDHAVRLVTRVLAAERKVGSTELPRGRFLFAGPPGVGKTLLSRQLARNLGYGQDAFKILNMGEYSTDGSRTRFIGADPGYVGYGASRTIYDVAHSRPSCVILLDEIDRAHPSIQDILLSILEGRGNNVDGDEVRFSQAIIIMTTNLGQEQIEAAYRDMREAGDDRKTIAASFDDTRLRELILMGATDKYEMEMLDRLDAAIEAARVPAAKADLASIDVYLALKQRRAALQQNRRHSSLDRAFLDRIDFIVPFFPIDEINDLTRVVQLKLKSLRWPDCPGDIQSAIVREVASAGSIRTIERLIKKRRLEEWYGQ